MWKMGLLKIIMQIDFSMYLFSKAIYATTNQNSIEKGRCLFV